MGPVKRAVDMLDIATLFESNFLIFLSVGYNIDVAVACRVQILTI